MDTRLIFRDLGLLRWSDGVLYLEPIIGFGSRPRGCVAGKSAMHKPKQNENVEASAEANLRERAFEKNF